MGLYQKYTISDVMGQYDQRCISPGECAEMLEEIIMGKKLFLCPKIEQYHGFLDSRRITPAEYCDSLYQMSFEVSRK